MWWACGSAFCGSCEWCMRGLLQHCESKGWARADSRPPRLTLRGQGVPALVGLGAFAPYLLVHERAVNTIPPEMPLARAALLGCAVLTGIGAVRHRAQVAVGQSVAVIGCGGVGLNAIQGARMSGAARIIAVDLAAAKLKRAQTFGATDVVDASDGDPVEAVRELTGGRRRSRAGSGGQRSHDPAGLCDDADLRHHDGDRRDPAGRDNLAPGRRADAGKAAAGVEAGLQCLPAGHPAVLPPVPRWPADAG